MKRVFWYVVSVTTFTIAFMVTISGLRDIPLNPAQVEILDSYLAIDEKRIPIERPSGFSEGYLGDINVLNYGQGRPVLLIPGNFHSAHSYEDTMRSLGKYFDMWSYSPRGTGNSRGDINQSLEESYDELRQVAHYVAIATGKKPIGLGHSFGGFMLRSLPEKDELFSGLVFLSPAPEYGFAGRVERLIWNTVVDQFDLFHSAAEKFSFVYSPWIAGADVSISAIASHARTIRFKPQVNMILESANDECLREQVNCPAGSELPTLFIAIEGDEAVPAWSVQTDYKQVRSKFSHSDFKVIRGAHIFPNNEDLTSLLRMYF